MCYYRYTYYCRCKHQETVLQAFCDEALPVCEEDAELDGAPAFATAGGVTESAPDAHSNPHRSSSMREPVVSHRSTQTNYAALTTASSALPDILSLPEHRVQDSMAGLASFTNIFCRTQDKSSSVHEQSAKSKQHSRVASEAGRDPSAKKHDGLRPDLGISGLQASIPGDDGGDDYGYLEL